MDLATLLSQPFVQVTLPIMFTILLAAWAQNRRVDALARRVGRLGKCLDRIEQGLDHMEQGLDRIEKRLDRIPAKLVKIEETTLPANFGPKPHPPV